MGEKAGNIGEKEFLSSETEWWLWFKFMTCSKITRRRSKDIFEALQLTNNDTLLVVGPGIGTDIFHLLWLYQQEEMELPREIVAWEPDSFAVSVWEKILDVVMMKDEAYTTFVQAVENTGDNFMRISDNGVVVIDSFANRIKQRLANELISAMGRSSELDFFDFLRNTISSVQVRECEGYKEYLLVVKNSEETESQELLVRLFNKKCPESTEAFSIDLQNGFSINSIKVAMIGFADHYPDLYLKILQSLEEFAQRYEVSVRVAATIIGSEKWHPVKLVQKLSRWLIEMSKFAGRYDSDTINKLGKRGGLIRRVGPNYMHVIDIGN